MREVLLLSGDSPWLFPSHLTDKAIEPGAATVGIKRAKEMLGLGEKPQAGNPPGPDNRQSEERPVSRSPKFELPTEEDLDKALSYAERMLKKFREKWKDIERGSGRGTQL